jgi:phosphoserine phosphatase RsbU/P
MRILPRFTLPKPKSVRRFWRQFKKHLTVHRTVYFVEAVLFVVIFLAVFSGRRAKFIDSFGRRSDLVVALLLVGLFALFHSLIRRHVLPRIERYFEPVPYDERKIFFDLGQGTRTVSTIDQLYESVAEKIREALEVSKVSIFVRDEVTGNYKMRVLSEKGERSKAKEKQSEDGSKSAPQLNSKCFVVRRLAGLSTPLTIEPVDLKTWAQALHSASPTAREAREQERKILESISARLLVQIRQKDELVGILSLGSRRAEFQYSIADKELLMSIAAQLALVIENASLTERMVAQERLRRELALAAEVQQRLLPSQPTKDVSIELAGFCEPARGVGGDYYDFLNFDHQHLGLAIADVAGKGMPAALLMSTVQATLRSLTARNGAPPAANPDLAQMVGKINRLLFNSTNGEHYVTFFYANFDQATRRLTYVNAGHNPPLYLKAGSPNNFRQLTAGGLVAGAFEYSNYDQETVQMESNDLLFLYTDGLNEAMNRKGEEFGAKRIMEMLASTASLSVDQIRDEVVRRVKEWCTGMPLHDDLTFVVVKVK